MRMELSQPHPLSFKMDAILTQRAIISLGISSLHFTAAILLTFLAGWLRKIPFSELLIVLWLFYDAIIHFTLVGVVYLKWVWYLYIYITIGRSICVLFTN